VVALCALATPASAVVNVQASVSNGTGNLCTGIQSGFQSCNVMDAAGSQITVTLSLTAATVVNGYDFSVQWDPAKLSLLSSVQLFPSGSPPNTIPFLIAPNPADPLGSSAAVLSLVGTSTTSLFRMTFQILQTLAYDCVPDLAFNATTTGLSPATVVLGNPAGASIDLGKVTGCNDGIDNEFDGKIDFDGGLCAGHVPVTAPDPECTSAATPTGEAPPASGCGLGPELTFLLPLLAWRFRKLGANR
jgi:hypothetical protein